MGDRAYLTRDRQTTAFGMYLTQRPAKASRLRRSRVSVSPCLHDCIANQALET